MRLLILCINFILSLSRRPNGDHSVRTRVLALAGTVLATFLAFHRLLRPGLQFVGNDLDMSLFWIQSTKFFRLWLHAGVKPLWNPFVGGGYALSRPEEFYLSGINLWQWLLPASDKSLDITLYLHCTLMALGGVLLFLHMRFSVLASLAAAAAFAFTGNPMAQLFAGHVNLYCSLCWAPLILYTFQLCLKEAHVGWVLLHALVLAITFSYGSIQGFYLTSLLNVLWHFFQLACGSPVPVPSPQLLPRPAQPSSPDLEHCPRVPVRRRLLDLGQLLLRLALAYTVCFSLTECYWVPQLERAGYTLAGDVYAIPTSPAYWITLFIPHFFLGLGQEYSWSKLPVWEGAPGIGGSFLLIALLAIVKDWREVPKPAIFVLLWGALAGLAWTTPFWKVLQWIDPWYTSMDAPSRQFFLCNFAQAVLLAWALQKLFDANLELGPLQKRTLITLLGLAGFGWILSFYGDADNPLWKLIFRSLQPQTEGRGYYVLLWSRYSAEVFLWLAYGFILLRVPQRQRLIGCSLLLAADLVHYPLAYLNFRPNEQLNLPQFAYKLMNDHNLRGAVANLYNPSWNGQFMIVRRQEIGNLKSSGPVERQVLARLIEPKLKAPKDLTGSAWEHPNPLYRFLGVELYLHNRQQLEQFKASPAYGGFTILDVESQNFVGLQDSYTRPPVYLTRSAQAVRGLPHLAAEVGDAQKFLANVDFTSPRVYQQMLAAFQQRGWQRHYEIDPRVPETADIVKESPNELHVKCQLQAPAILVVNGCFSEEWKVQVDGASDRVWPAQWGLNRAVLLDAGTHEVLFYLDDQRQQQLVTRSTRNLLLLLLLLTAYFGYRTVSHTLREEAGQ